MQDDLFSGAAEYTIDSSSLMAMFNDEPWTSKKNNPGLWQRVSELITSGVIISHSEVLAEIKKDGKKGEDLFIWANTNTHVFKPHDVNAEGIIIRSMSVKYRAFVNNYSKPTDVYADPWLVAQAKCKNLKIISQETASGNPLTAKLPNVCTDSMFGIQCLNLWQLVTEQGWVFV